MSTAANGSSGGFKNVVCVGASYVGMMVVDELKASLPPTHRLIVVEKNSHFGHLFIYPRYAALPTPSHKPFIPYQALPAPHVVVRAKALSASASTLTLDRPVTVGGEELTELPYDALILATGTKLSPPGTMPGEEKKEGAAYLQQHQQRVQAGKNIVILGGGAVGVQMATDIATHYGAAKTVTLVHSHDTLMPRFHPALSNLIKEKFAELGIKTVLGSRAIVPAGGFVDGSTVVETKAGEKVDADVVIVSTGQTPQSEVLAHLAPSALLKNGFIATKPTLQIDATEPGLEKVFAVGDIAETGAPKAARPAMEAAKILSRNLVKLLAGERDLEPYNPPPAAIHLTLGIIPSVIFRNPPSSDLKDPLNTFQGEPTFFWKDDGTLDMGVEGVWGRRAPGVTDYHL